MAIEKVKAYFKEKGIEVYYPVESNMVFCVINEKILSKMNEEYDLKYWYKDKKIVRIVTTFATTEADINAIRTELAVEGYLKKTNNKKNPNGF